MNKLTSSRLFFLASTATFLAFAAGCNNNEPPQVVTDPPQAASPVVQQSNQPVNQPITQVPNQKVSNEVSRLLQTKQCAGCNLVGANLQNAD